MNRGLRRWWPIVKLVVAAAVLFFIGRQFYRDLRRPELELSPLHPGWLALSAVLYVTGLCLSALYWRRLLAHLGPAPPWWDTLRAYFIGHLGKYVPGKAWALVLRTTIIHGAGVRLAVGTVTTFYEVLTTMASGVALAAVLFAVLGSDAGGLDLDHLWRLFRGQAEEALPDRTEAVLLSLALFALTAGPLVPPIFNRLVHHLSLPFREADTVLPQMRLAWQLEGLVVTAVGWCLLGASLTVVLQAITGVGSFWSPAVLGRLTAGLGLSYVIGFAVPISPGGLGVREFFLLLFVTPEVEAVTGMAPIKARGTAVLAVLLLRLVWTVAELLIAAALWKRRKAVVVSSQ